MKTLSNAELQDAIGHTTRLIKGDNSHQDNILIVHLENLTDEQRYRATDELTLEPMTTTLERAEFDARFKNQDNLHSVAWYGNVGGEGTVIYRDEADAKAQDGPEWIEWGGGECPVPQGHDVEVKFLDGQIHRDRKPEGWAWNARELSCIIEKYRDWTAWEQSK